MVRVGRQGTHQQLGTACGLDSVEVAKCVSTHILEVALAAANCDVLVSPVSAAVRQTYVHPDSTQTGPVSGLFDAHGESRQSPCRRTSQSQEFKRERREEQL